MGDQPVPSVAARDDVTERVESSELAAELAVSDQEEIDVSETADILDWLWTSNVVATDAEALAFIESALRCGRVGLCVR